MFLRKASNGNYYVCRRTSSNRTGRLHKSQTYRDWWLIKNDTYINFSIMFPDELIGKRIRLKVEVIEDEEEENRKRTKNIAFGRNGKNT